jgi:hypothetical protein
MGLPRTTTKTLNIKYNMKIVVQKPTKLLQAPTKQGVQLTHNFVTKHNFFLSDQNHPWVILLETTSRND